MKLTIESKTTLKNFLLDNGVPKKNVRSAVSQVLKANGLAKVGDIKVGAKLTIPDALTIGDDTIHFRKWIGDVRGPGDAPLPTGGQPMGTMGMFAFDDIASGCGVSHASGCGYSGCGYVGCGGVPPSRRRYTGCSTSQPSGCGYVDDSPASGCGYVGCGYSRPSRPVTSGCSVSQPSGCGYSTVDDDVAASGCGYVDDSPASGCGYIGCGAPPRRYTGC